MNHKHLYTIPPDKPFAATLAQGVLAADGGDPRLLARRLIFLPTRRACRAVREAFLNESGGSPMLLPRLLPLGDISSDELTLQAGPETNIDILPAMPSFQRQVLLARMVAAYQAVPLQMDRHLPLARALARLIDQVYTENLDLANLPTLVEESEFSHHWQITVKFLDLLGQTWPAILAEREMIDEADRRNRLINALCDQWQRTPPAYPVMAAGSTGSIPAVARLLGVIAGLPEGAVILPGLDQIMNDKDWEKLEDTHPQATLKNLLDLLSCDRHGIQVYAANGKQGPGARVRLASEIMRPANSTEEWQDLAWDDKNVSAALAGLNLIETAQPQQEADTIALILRETLETPGKTALVITPDRGLAQRISVACRKWGIELDDSSGVPLSHSRAARFFLSLTTAMLDGLRPSSLLAIMKHPCAAPGIPRQLASHLEKTLLRGPAPGPGPEGLLRALQEKTANPGRHPVFPAALQPGLELFCRTVSPFYAFFSSNERRDVRAYLEQHIALAEALSDRNLLWAREDGEALALFLGQLHDQAADFPDLAASDYHRLLEEFMINIPLRPAYGTHPRLAVMGNLEARLIHADRLILAGLNEGTWPPQAGTDPFLSRPMKKDFGLPSPERGVGLSAHDFVQGFCAKEVFLTRSRTVDGAPAIPARWLARLETVLSALGVDQASLYRTDIAGWELIHTDVPAVLPYKRPAPRPAVSLRPRRLSVTRIEKWLRDPYGIYAEFVLRLPKLEPLEKEFDAAAQGMLVHAILERFIDKTPGGLPDDAEALFLAIARSEMPRFIPNDADQALFWPRLVRMAGWFIAHESSWRLQATPLVREAYGSWVVQPGSQPFTLSGIADRIDRLADGTLALIDYKTGRSQLTAKGIRTAYLPQLPLEALMLQNGAFEKLQEKGTKIGTLLYLIINGGRKPGDTVAIREKEDIQASMAAAQTLLYALITAFEKQETPYYSIPVISRAPRFNDYIHLARVQEWTSLDEGEEAA